MGDNDKRKLIKRKAGPKNELLDELDSLKELLLEESQDAAATCDSDIPLLNDVVDMDAIELAPAQQQIQPDIPVLEEVSFPQDGSPSPRAGQKSKQATSGGNIPSEQELNKLIDMLVGHHLRRLRPKIKEEILKEVKRRYPALFR